MWHIELVKNKYESLEDLYSLLQYVFRLNKTADDSRRANIITDDLTGCLPAMIPDINNPDMVYRLMLFIIQRRHKDTPQLVRHRIVSFQASDCILPQDLILKNIRTSTLVRMAAIMLSRKISMNRLKRCCLGIPMA